MKSLLTLEQAVLHLRLPDDYLTAEGSDGPDLETELQDMIHAATGAVLAYMGELADDYFDDEDELATDSDDDPVAPPQVFAAAKMMLGYLWKTRDNDAGKEFEPGYLPRPVTALLYPLRDPAVG